MVRPLVCFLLWMFAAIIDANDNSPLIHQPHLRDRGKAADVVGNSGGTCTIKSGATGSCISRSSCTRFTVDSALAAATAASSLVAALPAVLPAALLALHSQSQGSQTGEVE